jgi:hypothetical protein
MVLFKEVCMSFSIRIGNYFDRTTKDSVVQLKYNDIPIMGYYANGEVKFYKEYDNPVFDEIEDFADIVNDLIRDIETSLDFLEGNDEDKFDACFSSLLDIMMSYENKLNKVKESEEV